MDGELYLTQTNWRTNGAAFPAPFDQKFHLILNLAVGGNWPGYPDNTTEFPQKFVIDYVRVYQDVSTGIEKEDQKKDVGFLLDQNYPNPFNSETKINYQLSNPEFVHLAVYDMLGRSVIELINQVQESGTHSVSFDASELSTGVYTYCLRVGNKYSSRKLILLK